MLSRIIHKTVPESDTAPCQASLLVQAVRDLVVEWLSNINHQKRGFCRLFMSYAKATGSLEKERLAMNLETTLRKFRVFGKSRQKYLVRSEASSDYESVGCDTCSLATR
jgi:hypothetical protein